MLFRSLAQLRSEDRASQAKHIDPLSEDDPSGSQVSHTITKTAMAVVIGILVLIVGMQIGYGVMRRLNTANLSESVSVDTVSTALKGGLEWGNVVSGIEGALQIKFDLGDAFRRAVLATTARSGVNDKRDAGFAARQFSGHRRNGGCGHIVSLSGVRWMC